MSAELPEEMKYWVNYADRLEKERDAMQAKLDDMKDREYNLTCRALDTTPEGREFLGQLDALQAKLAIAVEAMKKADMLLDSKHRLHDIDEINIWRILREALLKLEEK
jgi:beta-phosphoglucomutase-like phosphatase (HAD superfamily)